MAHESGPYRLLAIDQLSSRLGVPSLRRTFYQGELRLRGLALWDQYLAMQEVFCNSDENSHTDQADSASASRNKS